MLTFISLYCGIDGFRLGLERASPDFKCVWANDIDKHACQVCRKHWNDNTLCEGDIKNVDAKGIMEHDLLCAGFPCQSFSTAGRGRGFEDTRGTLFYDIARIAWAKRPAYLLLENVKGLLSNQQGYTFHRMVQILDVMGYDLQWQVLDSQDFGVPQHRERLFIIGHIRGKPRPKVFPIGSYSQENDGINTQNRAPKDEIANTLTTTYTRNQHGSQYVAEGNYKVRRLTCVEFERIQGFPDNWTEHGLSLDKQFITIPMGQRYTLVGNAVTPAVVKFIGQRLIAR